EQRHDRLLVRHGDVASAPVRIGAPFGQISGKPGGGDVAGAVIGSEGEPAEPVAVDRRRFRLRNRIADHLRIGSGHAGSSSSSRSAPSTGSSGMPSTVNISPSML